MSQSKDPDLPTLPGGSTKVGSDAKNEGVFAHTINQSGGKMKIIGQLKNTITIAVNLADHMVSYAARIKGVDVRMRDISDRIRATSSILHGIEILFEQLTSNPVDESLEAPDAAKDLYAELQSCEIWLSGVQEQMDEFMQEVPSPTSLEGKEREKVELAQERLVLLESRITVVEFGIQDHKMNLQIRLSLFSLSFSSQKPDPTWSNMISDLLSEFRRILLDLGKLRNDVEPKSLRPASLHPPGSPLPGRAPTPTAFNPRYAGWVIQRGSAYATGRDARSRSWSRPAVKALAFSSEQLYLQVMLLMIENGKRDRTLHDTYDRLGPERQRAISDLVARENQVLQEAEPFLEWRLAGIQPRTHRIDRRRTEIVSMLVFLKTELKPQVDSEKLRAQAEPSLRGGAGGAEYEFEDEWYADRHTLGARHVPSASRRERRRERSQVPSPNTNTYNTYAGLSHDTRQHHQRSAKARFDTRQHRQSRTEAQYERTARQQTFTYNHPIFKYGSRLAGVLWSARLDGHGQAYRGKGKARAGDLGRDDDALIHALVEDWHEVVHVWPRGDLTTIYNVAATAVPGFTHSTSAYHTFNDTFAATGTFGGSVSGAPALGAVGAPASNIGVQHPVENPTLAARSTGRRLSGQARRQGRIITLQVVIGTSRKKKEDGQRR